MGYNLAGLAGFVLMVIGGWALKRGAEARGKVLNQIDTYVTSDPPSHLTERRDRLMRRGWMSALVMVIGLFMDLIWYLHLQG